MELTKERALELHREMWNCIADEIEVRECVQDIHKLKRKFAKEHFPKEKICNNCFCCEYADIACELCPVEWGNECISDYNYPCEAWDDEPDERNGLYGNCRILYDNKLLQGENLWEEQADLARQIANLPERKVEGEV